MQIAPSDLTSAPVRTHSYQASQRRNYLRLLGLVFILAITIRAALYVYFPILLTDDSGDYLAATHEIVYHLNFKSAALRDWRMPGYPVFLALTYPLTHMQSDRIIIVQNIVGLMCVALGMLIGWQAGSRFLSISLGLFLAINPVYLLFEHMLLSEGIFLLVLMAFLTIWMECWWGKIKLWHSQPWISGALLGLISAAGILIRTNSVVLFGACILGTYLIKMSRTQNRVRVKTLTNFSLGLVIGLSILLTPWIWRNYQMYNNFSITNLANRNSFFLKGMLGHLDTTLPLFQEISQEIGVQEFGYVWLNTYQKVYPTNQAEKTAQRLLFEQVRYHPLAHLMDIADSLLCFGGICRQVSGERTSITFWFEKKVTKPDAVRKLGTVEWTKTSNPDYVFVDTRENIFLLRVWSNIGVVYLTVIRPFLFLFVLSLVCIKIGERQAKRNRIIKVQSVSILLLGAAYILLASAHAITTAGLDRYAAPFDVVATMFLLLILSENYSCT